MITIKLRQKLEDFIVEEVINIPEEENEQWEYNLYILIKKNIENLSAISYISKKFKVPLKDIGYCGLKDRHGITTQYITIPKKYGIVELNEKNLKVKLVKKYPKMLKIGALIGNKFKITIRDIKKEEILMVGENIRNLNIGIPNYYDEQRFGSVFSGKFIAKEYALENYEEILKIILTMYKKSEKKTIKDLKRYIKTNWGEWGKVYNYIKENNIKSRMFVNIIKSLKNGAPYKDTLKYIDNRLKKLFVSAYQSYLWNETLKEYLKNNIDKDNRVYLEYSCGSYLMYKSIDKYVLEELKDKKLPTIAFGVDYSKYGEDIKKTINKVLKKEKISQNQLHNLNNLGNMTISERSCIFFPNNLNYGKFKNDELNRGKYKISLSFQLNKGSYATMVVKRLFI